MLSSTPHPGGHPEWRKRRAAASVISLGDPSRPPGALRNRGGQDQHLEPKDPLYRGPGITTQPQAEQCYPPWFLKLTPHSGHREPTLEGEKLAYSASPFTDTAHTPTKIGPEVQNRMNSALYTALLPSALFGISRLFQCLHARVCVCVCVCLCLCVYLCICVYAEAGTPKRPSEGFSQAGT